MKKFIIPFTIFLGTVFIPHAVYSGATRIIDADQLRSGAALLSLPTATQTLVGTSESQTLTNKTLTSPSISTPTGLVKGDVGLGNVDNTSDATKNAASATLTNKTLTAPVINSPTGIVKGDVGLGNVDNTSDATKNAAAVQLTNKDIDGGTASNTSRITIPKNTLANATALTRKEGTIIYATDQAKPYYDTGSALVAVGSGSGSGSSGYNTIQNTDAETDTSNWTESGGTFTRTNTSGEFLLGAYSFKWTPSAAQNLRSAAVTIPDGLFGRNCYASVIYKTDSSDYTMQVLDGSNNVLGSYAMPAASTAKIAPINFVCPTSGSIKLGFVTTASAVFIAFDSTFLGEATNISTSTNVTDWVAYTPTLGSGFGSATNISFFYARSGDTLLVKGTFTTGTTAASLGTITLPSSLSINTSKISISNTTSNPGPQVGTFAAPNANYYGPLVTATGTSSSLVYVGDQIANANKLTPQNVNVVIGSTVVVSVEFSVPIQGWSAEPAFRPDLAAVSWSGTSTLTGTTTSASYADPGSVSGAITTVNSRNLTCTAAASLVGISCTFPRTGTVEVCFDGDKSGSTTNTVTTRLADGSGTAIGGDNAVAMFTASAGMPLNDCVQYNVTSLSAQTFKIQMKVNTGTGTVNPKSFSVKMLDQGFPAPILLGSVTSKSTTAEGIERVTFGGATEGTNNCTGSPCTIYRSSAGISSVTRSATGIYVINFVSGAFSSAPTCVANGIIIGTGTGTFSQSTVTNPTSTTFNLNSKNSSSIDADGGNINVTCMGPK